MAKKTKTSRNNETVQMYIHKKFQWFARFGNTICKKIHSRF